MIPDKIIDFHVHLFPNKLFNSIWEHFSRNYNWDVLHRLYSRECITYLTRKNVVKIVYSNYAHKAGVAEGLNRWNLSLLNKYENLFCFAAYHPDDIDAISKIDTVLEHPRVLGIKLQHLVQDFYPDDERLFPLYDLIIKKNKRILFHVGTGPAGNKYVGINNFGKLMQRYPDLPANIAHMGGFEFQEFFDLLQKHQKIYFDTSFSFLPEAGLMFNLGNKCLEKNKNRILYGSDFPNLIFPRKNEINCLLGLGLSKDFYNKIFFENANRLILEIARNYK